MKILSPLFFLFIALISFQSCYYDIEEELYPKAGCDVTVVTLLARVKPIIQGSCYSCHSTQNCTSSGAGINLEDYAGLRAKVDDGKLLKSINHIAGISPMPKGSTAKIDACEIKIIEKWVADGAKND